MKEKILFLSATLGFGAGPALAHSGMPHVHTEAGSFPLFALGLCVICVSGLLAAAVTCTRTRP
jgi:hypothetical protein